MAAGVLSNRPASAAACPLATLPAGSDPYDSYAGTYDDLDAGLAADAFGIPKMRQQLLGLASGNVLEVGVGTGINLPLYDRTRVAHVTGVDLSPGMLQQAGRRVDGSGLSGLVDLKRGDVAALPFDSDQFDCVVDTFSLCVFTRPAAALAEMARVVKPGGQVLLLEHSRSGFAPLSWYQDITADAVAANGKGCYWNQDLDALLREAGLHAVRQDSQLGGLIRLVVAQRTA